MPLVIKTEEERNPILTGEQAVATNVEIVSENDLTQPIFDEGEEEKLALQFIEENDLYVKFMLWCGIQDQLKKIKDSLVPEKE